MKYSVELKNTAIKDLRDIPRKDATRITEKLKLLEDDLKGGIKRLTNFTPEYRLRVGTWRILFEIEGSKVVVYRVKHRREAYLS